MATQPPLPLADGDGDSIVDRDVWLACAVPLSRLPTVGDEVYYFPDGHAEHLAVAPLAAPHRFPCTVTDVSLGADNKTDEVFAKISLRPGPGPAAASPAGPGSSNSPPQKLRYFTKELSQTDATKRFCIPLETEHVFPKLDTDGADPRVQHVLMRDTRGKSWKFCDTYRVRVKRRKQHLLTTGWIEFANAKLLVAGDTIVFMRRPNGDLIVGLRRRRVPRDPIVCQDHPDQPAQDVTEAARLAAAGRPFTVTYFPRQAAVEFIVPRSEVDDALATSWEPGAQVRMQVMEDENKQRTVWVRGRVKAIRQNIWRMLEIVWGEAVPLRLASTMRSVNAWQVAFPPSLASTGMLIGSESQAQGPSSTVMLGASRHTGGPSAAPSAIMHTGDTSTAPSAMPPRTISTPSASPPNDPVSLPPFQNVKSIKLFGETISVDGGGSEQMNRAPPPPNGGGDVTDDDGSVEKKMSKPNDAAVRT